MDLWEPRIVWLSGPHPAAKPDISVFRGANKDEDDEADWDRTALLWQLNDDEYLIGDSGYAGLENVIVTQEDHSREFKQFQGDAKSRGETPFGRAKAFDCLGRRFHLGRNKAERLRMHTTCVEAIFVIIQYDYENGRPPYSMKMPPSM